MMERIKHLVKAASERTATDAELLELSDLIRNEDTGRRALTPSEIEAMADTVLRADLGIKQPAKIITIWKRVAAAAVILVMLSVGGYFYFNKQSDTVIAKTDPSSSSGQNDVAPGKSGAILTLASGKTILLDTASNGKVLNNFTKKDESVTVESSSVQYATLTTPRARTQQLTLSDGSKVWLNAASSIHFPTLFTGKQRLVEITGEVYFEVAHNASKPFHVKVNGMTVEVLGTHFNVNAYNDENIIKTTLLEGSVKVVPPPDPLRQAQDSH